MPVSGARQLLPPEFPLSFGVDSGPDSAFACQHFSQAGAVDVAVRPQGSGFGAQLVLDVRWTRYLSRSYTAAAKLPFALDHPRNALFRLLKTGN